MLNTSWYSLLDVLGRAPMISRPGYTTFALQTRTFSWNFVSVGAEAYPSLCDDGWFDGSSVSPFVCSLKRGSGGTNGKEDKVHQQHLRHDEQNTGLCILQPCAPRERINQLPALRPHSHSQGPQNCLPIFRLGSTIGMLLLATRQRGDHDAMQQLRAE